MISSFGYSKIKIIKWIFMVLTFTSLNIFIVESTKSTSRHVQTSTITTNKRFRWIMNKPQCLNERRTNKVDRYIEKLISFGKNGRKFPESHQQIKPFCNETRQMVAYIDSYFKECYKPDIQKLANIVLYSLKRYLRLFCNKKPSNRKLKKLISLMPCLNKYIEEDDCVKGMMDQLAKLVPTEISGKNKIKYVCCFYAELVHCGDLWLESIPCIKEDRIILLDFLRGISGDIVSVACNEYNEYTNRCEQLEPLKTTSNYKYHGSILNIIIDMVESMDGFLI